MINESYMKKDNYNTRNTTRQTIPYHQVPNQYEKNNTTQ